jgi:class 3 adenylate cyclase
VEPEHHESVTIFFSDIVGFTDISRTLSAVEVMDMLDRLYIAFDGLAEREGVFKVGPTLPFFCTSNDGLLHATL